MGWRYLQMLEDLFISQIFNPPSRSSKLQDPQATLSDEEIAAWVENFYTLTVRLVVCYGFDPQSGKKLIDETLGVVQVGPVGKASANTIPIQAERNDTTDKRDH